MGDKGQEIIAIDSSDSDRGGNDLAWWSAQHSRGEKRSHTEYPEDGAHSKRARRESGPASEVPLKETPIKLFATRSDVIEREKHAGDMDHWSRSQTWTLREMLGFDGNRPHGSIDWLVICNYLIDFDFLLDEIPELISTCPVLVFYGHADTPWSAWKEASPNSDFIRLDPSDAPGANNPLTLRLPYGVHHSKMFLVGFSDGTLRVVIHTANLRPSDIHLKAQGAYIQDFPLKSGNSSEDEQNSEYENNLTSYLQSYRHQSNLCATTLLPQETLVQRIHRSDFRSASVRLIPSIPGYHRLDARLGHLELKRCIKSYASPVDRNTRIVCQFSSIGSLTEKYLSELQESMSAKGTKYPTRSNLELSLVYPTVQEIRASVQGYQGGGSVPGTMKNVTKPFLRRLFCRWASPSSLSNPIWKSRNVPHIKTYYQTSSDNESMSWLVLSSHNLSKAAWGDAINSKWGGRRLFIRHWELGVFLSPKLIGADRLIPWSLSATAKKPGDASVPLPFYLHPESYQADDQPWAVDAVYSQADAFGRHSTHDP